MAKNAMIGSIVCGLAGMDTKFVKVVAEVTNRMNSGVATIYRDRFLKGARQPLPKGKPREYRFLKPVEPAVAEFFNPQSMRGDEDIWLSPEFIEDILSVAEPFQPPEDSPRPNIFNIKEPANDSGIRSELPADHAYSASEFCWQARQMTRNQPNGAEGQLLNGGFANIFYVIGRRGEAFAVLVYWWSVHGQWRFYRSRLDDRRWYPGHCAFSRN